MYFLQEPSTNAFSLFHDYTESRPGIDKYLNVVRTGSHVSNPSAYILDTGETLRHETLKGDAITAAKIDAGSGHARHRSRRRAFPTGESRTVRAPADLGDVHRTRELSTRRRRISCSIAASAGRATRSSSRPAGI